MMLNRSRTLLSEPEVVPDYLGNSVQVIAAHEWIDEVVARVSELCTAPPYLT